MRRFLFSLVALLVLSCTANAAIIFQVVPNDPSQGSGNVEVHYLGGPGSFQIQAMSTTPNETLNSYSLSWFNNTSQFVISPEPALGTPNISVGGAWTTLDTISVNFAGPETKGTIYSAVQGVIQVNGVNVGTSAWGGAGGSFAVQAVPEPSSMALLGITGAGLGFYRSRRKRKSEA